MPDCKVGSVAPSNSQTRETLWITTRGDVALPDTAGVWGGGGDGRLAASGTGGFPCVAPCSMVLQPRTGVVPGVGKIRGQT